MRETSGEIQENRGFNLKKIVQRAASLALVTTAISIPMANEARADVDLNTKPVSNIDTKGEMPSQNTETSLMSRDEVSKRVKDVKVEAPSVPREVVVQLMEKYDQDNLGPYYQELKEYGCTDIDRMEDCARWLNSIDSLDTSFIKYSFPESLFITRFVNREAILKYSISGEGLNVYENKDNGTRFLIVVAGEKPGSKSYKNGVNKITKNFKAAFEYMEQNGINNPDKAMWENGFNTFYACEFSEGDYTMGTLFEEGVIIGNFDDKIDKKDFQMMRNFCRLLPLESLGIGMFRLNSGAGIFTDFTYIELIKGMMSGDNWEYLYKNTGKNNEELRMFSTVARGPIASFLENFYMSPQDSLLKKLFEDLTEGNLLRPIGAENWQEVEALVEETPESRPWLK